MLAAVLITAVFGSDSIFELFPADRSQVPVLKQKAFTVAEWQRIDEDFAKGERKYERILRGVEHQEKQSRQLMREMNAIDHKWGIRTKPDPEEPKESKFFPKKGD